MDVAVGLGDTSERTKGAVQVNEGITHGMDIEKGVRGSVAISKDQCNNR